MRRGSPFKRRAQASHVTVPEDVFAYIATNIASNIRELEGAFNTVLCYSLLAGSITIDVASEALKDIIQPMGGKRSIAASSWMWFPLLSCHNRRSETNRRSREVTAPRQVAMYLCRNLLNMTLPQIGHEFGNRDHTTVMHSCNKVSEAITKDDILLKEIEDIKKRIAN